MSGSNKNKPKSAWWQKETKIEDIGYFGVLITTLVTVLKYKDIADSGCTSHLLKSTRICTKNIPTSPGLHVSILDGTIIAYLYYKTCSLFLTTLATPFITTVLFFVLGGLGFNGYLLVWMFDCPLPPSLTIS